ncbi:galactosylceramide sulfotransferase-like [Antedon mediterranea]|uniref:galactosylceramide sulfotransferase-like n=1 Tax=Antedon mediterranea TaxID=105859 RepID=UPI003AF5EE46
MVSLKNTLQFLKYLQVILVIGVVVFVLILITHPSLIGSIHNVVAFKRITKRCESEKNVAFVKTHKTGGTTVARIVEQFALVNHLNIVRKKGESSYLHFTNRKFNFDSKKDFLQPMGVGFGDWKNYINNVFSLHARFDKKVYRSFMANNSVYITILRDPVTQFESTFDYFGIGSIIGKGQDNKTLKLETFLNNPTRFWNNLSSSKQKRSFNNQIWDLGVDPKPNVVVNETIKRLDNEFDLVMITEYFDESLLILKKMLCWEFTDILYLPRNQRSERVPLSNNVRKKIMEWNSLDTQLYQYFLKRLQDHINNYGPSFQADLVAFRRMTSFVYKLCVSGEHVWNKKKKIKYERRDDGNFTSKLCKQVDLLHVCDFGGGYILKLNLESMCKSVTSDDRSLNRSLRQMMKEISLP